MAVQPITGTGLSQSKGRVAPRIGISARGISQSKGRARSVWILRGRGLSQSKGRFTMPRLVIASRGLSQSKGRFGGTVKSALSARGISQSKGRGTFRLFSYLLSGIGIAQAKGSAQPLAINQLIVNQPIFPYPVTFQVTRGPTIYIYTTPIFSVTSNVAFDLASVLDAGDTISTISSTTPIVGIIPSPSSGAMQAFFVSGAALVKTPNLTLQITTTLGNRKTLIFAPAL